MYQAKERPFIDTPTVQSPIHIVLFVLPQPPLSPPSCQQPHRHHLNLLLPSLNAQQRELRLQANQDIILRRHTPKVRLDILAPRSAPQHPRRLPQLVICELQLHVGVEGERGEGPILAGVWREIDRVGREPEFA